MPTQSLNDKAFMNPLYGNVGFSCFFFFFLPFFLEFVESRWLIVDFFFFFHCQASVETEDYEEVEKDIYELLEKETELRQTAEARALKAEQGKSIALHRIKDLELQLEAVSFSLSTTVLTFCCLIFHVIFLPCPRS